MLGFLRSALLGLLLSLVTTEDFKETLIREVNEAVDIPNLDEEEEEEWLEANYTAIQTVIIRALQKEAARA